MRVQDGHRGDASGDHGENMAVVPRPPPPPLPADSDELRRRQAAKDKIRERILREEVEHWALEAEVRREIMEHLFPLLRPGLGRSAGARAEGSDAMAAPAGTTTAMDSPPPILLEGGLKANVSATLPAKRKNPDVTPSSAVSAAASRKKQKPADLACTVCGMKATSMKAMQDHLMGRGHKRKAAALAQPKLLEAEREEEEEEEEAVLTLPSGGYTPTKFTMLTNAGAMIEVLQMDGYLLCEVCNVRTTDRVTMMCHLEGNKHILKAQKQCQAGKPPAVGAAAAAKKDVKGDSATAIAAAVAAGDPETAIMAVYGVPCIVRRADGFVLCKCCDVKVSSENDMQSHLAGQKHRNKAKVSLQQGKAKDVASVAGAVQMEVESATLQAKAKADDASVSVALKQQDGVPKIEEVTAIPVQAGDHGMLQKKGALAGQHVAANIDDIPATPGQEVKKVHAPAISVTVAVTGGCSETVVIDVDNVQHVVQLVDGVLLCECCDVKALSDCVMRSHLSGKKHKKNANKVAAGNVGAGGKEAAALSEVKSNEAASVVTGVGHMQGNDSTSANGQAAGEMELATMQEDTACAAISKAPMNAVEPAKKIEDDASIAEEDDAASDVKTTAQGEESTKTDGIAAAGQEVKIQVEGKMCTVLRQADSTLSCYPCRVHGRDKDGILQHLYTRAHWNKVSLDEEKERPVAAAPAVVEEARDAGRPATEGTAVPAS